jgi:hypothetical protein
MWTISTNGFWSAVAHNTQPDTLVVRSRVRADSQYLADWCNKNKPAKSRKNYKVMVSTKGQDYPFRVFVPKPLYAQFMLEETLAVDYGNFKSAVGRRQGYLREQPLHDVWGAMAKLEHLDPNPRPGGPGWAAGARPHWLRVRQTARSFYDDLDWGNPAPRSQFIVPRDELDALSDGPTEPDDIAAAMSAFFAAEQATPISTTVVRTESGDAIDGPADCFFCNLHTLDASTVDLSGDRCPMSDDGAHHWVDSVASRR